MTTAGVPLAWVITSAENEKTVGKALKEFHERVGVEPSCVISDAAAHFPAAIK